MVVGVLCDSKFVDANRSHTQPNTYDQKRTGSTDKTSVRAENDLERARNQVGRGFIFCAEKPP
jgi:hypothetical protein